jgi:Protein kinase domain
MHSAGSTMLLYFDCPKCLKVVKADSSQGGDTAMCPHCESHLLIPMDAVGSGTIVGGFHLVKKLGVGGMGDVYLAEQPSLKRQVALKVLPPAMTRKERFLDRFIHEIKIHGALQHPNVAMAYDAGCDRDIYYLAMEYVEGRDLNRTLEERTRLPEAEALRITREVALPLKHAWDRKKIIHCDIKPGNIMLTAEGGVKVLDMGLSKSLVDMADLTQTGYMVGTPLYMSPEQADGSRTMDFRSDLYSLGSALYHMATGTPPFTGKTVSEVVAKRATQDPRPARELNPDLTPGLENLLRRLLQRKPEQRFRDYDEFLVALDRVRRGKRIPAAAGPRPAARFGLAALGSLLLLGAGLILLSGKRPEAGTDIAEDLPAPVPDDNSLAALLARAEARHTAEPGQPGLHLKTFETLRDDARARGETAVALRAEEHIRALREQIDAGVNAIVADLRAKAIGRINAHDYIGASEVIQSYTGPLRLESESARRDLGQAIKAQAASQRAEHAGRYLRDLESNAETLVRDGRAEEALKRVEEGEGPLGLVTRDERREMAKRLRQRLENTRPAPTPAPPAADPAAIAEREWSVTLTRLAALVRKGGTLDALGIMRSQVRTNEVFTPVRARSDQVEKDLLAMARTDFLVLNSYTNEVGREVEIQLTRGAVRVRVDRVNPPVLETSRRTEQGLQAFKWTVEDLSLAEKWRRAESLKIPEVPLLCAQLAFTAGNDKAARAALAKHTGELAAALREPLP